MALWDDGGDPRLAFGGAGESVLLYVEAWDPTLLDPLLYPISRKARALGLPAVTWEVGEATGSVDTVMEPPTIGY